MIIVGEKLSIAELAAAYKEEIRKLIVAIANADKASANLATRFSNYSNVVENQFDTAFKNRFNKALLEEMNIASVVGLTVAQQRNYCLFCRIVAAQYAVLALFGIDS